MNGNDANAVSVRKTLELADDLIVLIKGTKKSYCYELTEKGFDQERVVRRMKKKL